MIDPRREGDITRPGPARKLRPPRGPAAHAGALSQKGFSWKRFPVRAMNERAKQPAPDLRGMFRDLFVIWIKYPVSTERKNVSGSA